MIARIVSSALALAFLAGASSHPIEQPKAKESAAQSERAQSRQPNSANVPSPVQQVRLKRPPCGPDQYGSNDDLCAQWKAADAAVDAATWSWWQMMIAAGGLLVGAVTMAAAIAAAIFAKKAAVETEKSATAALDSVAETREANRIARQTGEAQVRCYLSIQDVQVSLSLKPETKSITPSEPHDPNKKDPIYPNIFFKVHNHGNSPARHVSFRYSLKFSGYARKGDSIISYDRQSERRFPRDQQNDKVWGELIPASSDLPVETTFIFSLSDFERSALSNSDAGLSLILVISVLFTDVFDQVFSEDLCFVGGWQGQAGTSPERGRVGLRAMPIECFETQAELQRRREANQQS